MVFGVFMVDSDRKTHLDDAPEFAEVVFFPPCTDPRSLYNLILFHHVHVLFNLCKTTLTAARCLLRYPLIHRHAIIAQRLRASCRDVFEFE